MSNAAAYNDMVTALEWYIDHGVTDVLLNEVNDRTLVAPVKKQSDIQVVDSVANKVDAPVFLGKSDAYEEAVKLARQNIPARIINKNNEIHIVTNFLELKGRPKDFLSIIPITEKVTGITLRGLEYPLVNATLEMGSCLGVSNSFKEAIASVSIEKGILIVTKSTD